MKKLFNQLKSFSIAEAMVTLLIVSVAIAAMAPIMSKRNQTAGNGLDKWLYTQNGRDITRVTGNVGVGVPTNQNPDAKFEIRGNNGVIIKIKAPGMQNANILDISKGNKQIAYMDPDGVLYLPEPVIMRNSASKTGWNPLTTYEGNDWRNALMRDGGLMVNTTEVRRVLSIFLNGSEKAWINSDGTSSFGGVCAPRYGVCQGKGINTNITADQNGWLSWNGWAPDRWTAGLWINGQRVLARGAYKYGDETSLFVPVSKNDVYTANHGSLCFTPCKN